MPQLRGPSRLAIACALMLLAICGCGSKGDQTANRLKDMTYTVENLASEVEGRLKEIDRRAARKEPEANDPGDAPVGERHRSSGPGGYPFTIERVGEDVAHKLKMIDSKQPAAALEKLTRQLKEKGITEEKLAALVAAVKEYQ
ncbi:MAG: hypothetical protein JWP89_5986 [Schlesneria sp.]|nr:hypothetical protein [Schlesneria sp.]